MEIIKSIILNVTTVLQILAFSVLGYYLCISLFGLYRKKDNNYDEIEDKTFALVVAAHNEEVVIEQIVESLRKLEYKKELYDIFVIADNCNDETAKLARNAGAMVCERFDKNKRGKGYALEWMFGKIFQMEKKYDAVVVFDADNLASKNFLTAMNNKLKEGYKVVQGYLDSKNPHDSWITESYSIAFWSNNRLFQLARNNLGLSNQIGGTGFCIDIKTLKELGWGATCLTEDLEFTCKLVTNGHRVGWAHEAVIYDEKPLTLKQSWNQRKRWMQGFADVASRFFFKLLKKAFKERSWTAFDCAIYTIQPYITILSGIVVLLTAFQFLSREYIATLVTIFKNVFGENMLPLQIFAIFQFVFTPVVMFIDKKISKSLLVFFALYSSWILISGELYMYLRDDLNVKDIVIPIIVGLASLAFIIALVAIIYIFSGKKQAKSFIWYLIYPVYVITWLPITIHAIINRNDKEWSHTKHTRGISISDLEKVNKKSVA